MALLNLEERMLREDEPGKASMHANRPSFCSELPRGGFNRLTTSDHAPGAAPLQRS